MCILHLGFSELLPCLRPRGQWNATYEQALCEAMQYAWRETLENDRVQQQTIRYVERRYRTIVTQLLHYVPENQNDWDKYVQLLMYAFVAQVRKSTNTTCSCLVSSWQSPGLTTVPQPNAITSECYVETDHW